MCWHICNPTALWRWRYEDCEFEANLAHIAKDLVSKKKKKAQKVVLGVMLHDYNSQLIQKKQRTKKHVVNHEHPGV
jgi:hypothetical protein